MFRARSRSLGLIAFVFDLVAFATALGLAAFCMFRARSRSLGLIAFVFDLVAFATALGLVAFAFALMCTVQNRHVRCNILCWQDWWCKGVVEGQEVIVPSAPLCSA